MGKKRIERTGYIIVQVDEDTGNIVDTLDATFDRATAEEMVMTFAYEWLWRRWYFRTHGNNKYNYGYITMAYEGKLSDAPIEIREVHWHE